MQVHLTTLIGGGAGGDNRHERRRRGEGGAENEANRSLAKMQSNGSRNGASGDWAARRGSRKQSEAVGAPGCVSSGRPTPSRKADPETAGGRLLTFADSPRFVFRRFCSTVLFTVVSPRAWAPGQSVLEVLPSWGTSPGGYAEPALATRLLFMGVCCARLVRRTVLVCQCLM